ncbi:MAG TPA: sulfatase [Candidatus Binatia bacterium]|nr:sulfatase [Candidatus Binatia bacterium]
MRTFAACLGLVALVALPGCRRATPMPPDVLLIVADTLRADRLGAWGNRDRLTPFLDSLAARGTAFRRAYAQTSWTNPSVASLITSRYQSQHGVVAFKSVLPASETTLAEALHAAGYTTGGFSANGLIGPQFGFGQGYDRYRAHFVLKRDAPQYMWMSERGPTMNAEALQWIDFLWSQGHHPSKPVFLYLQYMETHSPYAPLPAFLARVRGDESPLDLHAVNEAVYFGHLLGVSDVMLHDIVDVYDAEVLALDAAIQQLFAALGQRGFLDNAVVIITADHGEEFKEHGLMGHEKTLYEEVIHVPLLVLMPGQTRPVVVDDVVSLVDVAPTLLDVLGIAAPAGFEGVSRARVLGRPGLRPWLRRLFASAPAPSSAYTELIKPEGAKRFTPHERALVLRDRKLIEGVAGEREFYRLDVDPGEKDPQGVPAGEREALATSLAEMRARATRAPSAGETKPLDEETKQRMRALGYTN